MVSIYLCEVCGKKFDNELECMMHEKVCDPVETHLCYKCGKEESWTLNDPEAVFNREAWHEIRLGRMGYCSSLDGRDVNYEICDDCLYEHIETFVHKKKILNSGVHYWKED